MAIIYPSHCKGVTAGALRQLQNQGFTTASGGLFATQKVNNMINAKGIYFSHTEQAGVFMENLNSTKQKIEENTETPPDPPKKIIIRIRVKKSNTSLQKQEIICPTTT